MEKMTTNNPPICIDCGTPIKHGQGFSRLNGRDDSDGLRHIYPADCRKGLLDRVSQLESENATLRHMLEHKDDMK